MKTPVIRRKDYVVCFESYHGLTFIHCECASWSKTIKQNLIKDFDVLCSIHEPPIYAFHEIGDSKHLKFLEMFGFKYLHNVVGLDNIERQLFERNT